MRQFQQGAIGLVSDLFNSVPVENRISARVHAYSHWKPLGNVLFDVFFGGIVNSVLQEEEPSHCHFVHCQSTGLVGTDVVSSTHSLTGLQETDQVVFVFHLADRVGQGDSHSQGQAFRDGHHNDADCDNEGINQVMESVEVDEFSHKVSRGVSSIDDVTAHAGEGKVGRVESQVSDLVGESWEFDLQRCFIFRSVKFFLQDAILTVLSNCENYHSTSAFKNFRARDQEGVDLFFFFPSGNGLLNSNRLSSHRGLVSHYVMTFNQKAVNWDNFTSLHDLNVSN